MKTRWYISRGYPNKINSIIIRKKYFYKKTTMKFVAYGAECKDAAINMGRLIGYLIQMGWVVYNQV